MIIHVFKNKRVDASVLKVISFILAFSFQTGFAQTTINCPPALNLTCNQLVPAPDISLVTATASSLFCTPATVSFVADAVSVAGCIETTVRTYRSTDACSSTAECTQIITRTLDNIPPTIICPATITLGTNVTIPLPNPASVTATDNCGTPIVTFVSDVVEILGSVETTTRTYKATDGCGNIATCSQLIKVVHPQSNALPANGTNSSTIIPQGNLRYQRGFYLVTPKEMKASELLNNMTINSIGFTIGAAQNDTTKGRLQIFLQNTRDTTSRVDTGWTTVNSIPGSSYKALSLFPGNYEWQVKTNYPASNTSVYSAISNFTNDNLKPCVPPTSLTTTNITDSSARLNWIGAPAGSTKYYIEYTRFDVINWIRDSTSNATQSFYTIPRGLLPSKGYQWRIRTKCSTDSADFAYTSFTTADADSCSEPIPLPNTIYADTSVKLKWTGASGANYYFVRFKRVGTMTWNTTTSLADSITLRANSGLAAGTNYEWQVRTKCSAGVGAYVSGTSFTTTGSNSFYSPENLSTDSITSVSAKFTWNPVPGAVSYDLRFRVKKTISWVNAINNMTMVSDTIVTIPKTTGAFVIPFHGGNPFQYIADSGLYVAWEYSRPTGPLATSPNVALSTFGNVIIKGSQGQDSIEHLLSFVSRSDAALPGLPSILGWNTKRPETSFGSSALKDSVAIVAVYTLGNTASKFQSPTAISALIANKTASNKNYNVKLTIKKQQTGSVRFETIQQNFAVAANDSALIQFNGWSPTIQENDSVIISIPQQPNENVIGNNSKYYLQTVTANILAYDDGSSAVSSAGFGIESGLLLNRHTVNGCGKVISAQIYLAASAKNHPLYAVVRNTAGTIVAQSPQFTPDSTRTNSYHTFYFNNPPTFNNQDFYIGLAQLPSPISYRPVGIQWEDAVPRTGAYYKAKLDGTGLVDTPMQGRLMIKAEIVSSTPEPFISGNLKLCIGGTNILTAGSTQTRFADSVVSFSSQYSNGNYSAQQALGTPNVYPAYAVSPDAWVSNTPDGQREYLVLHFPEPAEAINFIDIYETMNPGAVDTVYVKNPNNGQFDQVYASTAARTDTFARKNHITFNLTAYNVSEIRIAVNSALIQGLNMIDAVGIGRAIVPSSFASYLWSPGPETTVTKSVSTPGIYKVTITNANGCQSSDSVTVVNAITTRPVITARSSTTFCQGDSVRLVSSIHGGNTWSNGATTDSITVKTPGSYKVSYNDGSGCGILESSPLEVTVNLLPVFTITGNLSYCPGSSTILGASAAFSSYLWSTGATTATISVSSSGIYGLTVTNANGCRKSANVSVNESPIPSPIISGTLDFCQGVATILDAGLGYSSYLWSTGATSRTINVNTEGTFTVTVTNANGCSGSNSVNTSFLSAPTPYISGGSSICPGGAVTLTANEGYTSYVWSTGATSAAISVNSANSYTVTVTADNGCSGSVSKLITQATPPVPAISGTLSFCGGNATTLDAGVGYDSYLWSTGSTSHSILVSTAGTFTVTVTDGNGCSGSASVTTTKTGSVPVTPGPISGNTAGVCGSNGNVYMINPVPNTSFYVWTVPAGATITSGQSTTSITVSYSNLFTTGNIVVAASNACGQSPSLNPRILTIQSAPAAPGPISGPVSGLCQQIGKVYSIAAVNGATSYNWTVPAGVTINSGQGSTSITVSFNNTFGAGNIAVTASNTCGASIPVSLSVQGASAVPGAITGQVKGLCGQTGKVFSIVAVSGATTYTWNVPIGATITAGQGTVAITVSFANNFGSGNICVKANNTCGSSASNCLSVAGLPAVPGSITGATVVCYNQKNITYSVALVPGTITYNWTVPPHAKVASGQGTPNITVTFASTSGNISVNAKNGCGTSAVQTLAVTSTICPIASKGQAEITVNDKSESVMNIIIFPNPTDGMINIDIGNGIPGKYEVQLTNSIGQVVYRKDILWSGNIIQVTNLHVAAGIYNVKVFNKQFIKNIKLMIQ